MRVTSILIAALLLQSPQTPVKEQPSQRPPEKYMDDEQRDEDQRKPHPLHPHSTTTTTTVPPTTTTTTVPPTTTTVIPTTTTTVLPTCVTIPFTLFWDMDPMSTAVSVTVLWWGDGSDTTTQGSVTVPANILTAIASIPCRPEAHVWSVVAYSTDAGGTRSAYSNTVLIPMPALP